MNTQRIARLVVANTSCFLAYWIARLAVPWWFGIAALIVLNVALSHHNQRLFRLYHGLQTCLLIVYLALTAGQHTLQEFIAILLLIVLFEAYLWLAGNLVLSAETPVHFLRLTVIACFYAIFGNTDPLVSAVILVIMLASSMLAAVTSLDSHAIKRLIPGLLILGVVFAVAVASPIMRAPTLPRAAVWLVPGSPASIPKPSASGDLTIDPPALTLRRVLQEHFWDLFGFIYAPLAIMIAILAAAFIISISVLHNTWGRTTRALMFPLALVVTALVFTIVYTGSKTAQIMNGIAQANRLGADDFNDIVDMLKGQHILPDTENEVKATLETIAAAIYWIGASILLLSIAASIRDMVFEFRHEALLALLERSGHRKTVRTARRLASLDEHLLLQDLSTSITVLFALGVEAIARIGIHLRLAETATEFAQRVALEAPECSAALGNLADLFVRARYSPSSVTEADVLAAKSALQALKSNVHGMRGKIKPVAEEAHLH